MKSFSVVSVNISKEKGTVKKPVDKITCLPDSGIKGDAHAGPGKRQVSLLAEEDIHTVRASGIQINDGDFAENITTKGVDLSALGIGTKIQIGEAILEISQIGKACHSKCEIFKKVGDCIMPKKGVFAIVIKEGEIKRGDTGTYNI